MRSGLFPVTVVVVAAGATATVHAAPGDEPTPIVVEYADDFGCDEGGVAQMCAGFYYGSADATFPALSTESQGLTLTVSGDFDSYFDVDVRDEQVAGTWNIGGTWTMIASGPAEGRADVTLSGGGTISGDPSRFGVSGTQTNSGAFVIMGRSNSISNTESLDSVEVTVTDGTCVEVNGVWSQSWGSLASEVGWSGTDTINGEFTAIRQEQDDADRLDSVLIQPSDPLPTDAQYEAADLPAPVEAYARALNGLSRSQGELASSEEPLDAVRVAGWLDGLEEIERAVHEIRNLAGCEAEIVAGFPVRWSDIAAVVSTNITATIGTQDPDLDGFTIRRLSESLVRTGAIGIGSRLPAEDQAAIRDVLRRETRSVLAGRLQIAPDGQLVASGSRGVRGELFAALSAARTGDYPVEHDGGTVEWDDSSWNDLVIEEITDAAIEGRDDLFVDPENSTSGASEDEAEVADTDEGDE